LDDVNRMKIRDYYAAAEVRTRITEFLGGRGLDDASCYYIGRCFDMIRPGFSLNRPAGLEVFLRNQWDVARSLWDKKWLMADVDMEYLNFEFPAEPFLDYERCFLLQEPVVRAIERMFAEIGIAPLHTITGRGHHFTWNIDPTSPAFRGLAQLGRVPASLAATYALPQPPDRQRVDLEFGRAFAGLALVMEYVAHRIMEETQPLCPIPILPEAVDLGPQQRGREVIVLDISEYGDPLHTRAVRTPFSVYLKPWLHSDILTPETEGRIPVMAMVPTQGLDMNRIAPVMRDLGKAARWAAHVNCRIPDGSRGTEALLAQYGDSEIRRFHDEFYAVEPEPPRRWPATYDRLSATELPPMARYALEHPNDILLKPEFIRQVVAGLLERHWHPRHIAGLLRSKYERDYGWLNMWYIYSALTRADFHVRVLAGMIRTGRDRIGSLKCEV
jgi:hypothetical protein